MRAAESAKAWAIACAVFAAPAVALAQSTAPVITVLSFDSLIAPLSTKLNSELELPALPRQTGAQVASSAEPQKLDVKGGPISSKAFDEQDGGHPERAAELYRAVTDRFPEFGPARQNLARVQESGD